MSDTQPNEPKARVNQRNSRRQKPKVTTRAVALPNRFGMGSNIAVAVLDVSESGVRLKLKQDLPIGHEFEVKLENIASKGVKTTARVVWSVPAADGTFVIGARFTTAVNYGDLHVIALV
jgi:hypothetical protein